MRISLVTSFLSGGGAARILVGMANHWSAQSNIVDLFSYEDPETRPFYCVDDGVGLHLLGLAAHSTTFSDKVKGNLTRLWGLRKAVLAREPEVVVSFGDVTNVQALLALSGSGVPVIVSERTHPAFEPVPKVWDILRRHAYGRADAVVAQTSEALDFMREWGGRTRVVIPNFIAPLAPGEGVYKLPRPCIIAAGRLSVEKNYDLMLRAFSSASKTTPGWNLCIAGSGPLQTALEKRAVELGLDGAVHFLGQVKDMHSFFSQGDVFAMCSNYEGFPNALCEAMSMGLACLSTDCPSGPRNIITHERDGLLVPVGDEVSMSMAMRQLMGDESLRRRLGHAAREISQTLAVDAIMSKWDACINDVLREGSDETVR